MKGLSRSVWRKAVALLAAMIVFVFLYETRIFDSEYVPWTLLRETPAPGAKLPFSATAYCKGSTTASGVPARMGVAAADPTLLPVGSVVNVAAADPRYSGVYTIMDTGPEVKGRELDLYMWSCNEALRFGRREIQVTVLRLGWNPQASSPGLIDRLFRRRESGQALPPPDPPPPAGIAPEDATPETESQTPVEPASSEPGATTETSESTKPIPDP